MQVERLGVSVVVIEGTSNKTLRRAVGHIAGTALPGQPGNVGIAGHRDTFFRPLRNIQPDDIITLTTLRGEYRYRVVSTKVVSPDDVAVLDSDGNQILTLVTCYPFYYRRLCSGSIHRPGRTRHLTRVGSSFGSTSEVDETIRSIKPYSRACAGSRM